VSPSTQEARGPSEQEVRKMVDSDITQEVSRAPPTEVEAGAPPEEMRRRLKPCGCPGGRQDALNSNESWGDP
jgi:hypothetical protein